jgi:hypothetical protein
VELIDEENRGISLSYYSRSWNSSVKPQVWLHHFLSQKVWIKGSYTFLDDRELGVYTVEEIRGFP